MKKLIPLLALLFAMPLSEAQTLTGINPDSTEQYNKLTVTVTGENTNFYPGTTLIWLTNDSITLSPFSKNVISSTELQATFFFGVSSYPGLYDVNVRDGGYNTLSIPGGFEIIAVPYTPQLVACSPDSAEFSQVLSLTITGSHTHFDVEDVGNEVFLVLNNYVLDAYDIAVQDSVTVIASFHPSFYMPDGYYDIKVENRLDGTMIIENALYYCKGNRFPGLVSVNPDHGKIGESLSVTVTGSNTFFSQGTTILRLRRGYGVIMPESTTVNNDSVIVGLFNFVTGNDTGYYDVVVTEPGYGNISLDSSFYLWFNGQEPELLSVKPDSGYLGTSVELTIKGENTKFDNPDDISVILKEDWEELYGKDIVVLDSETIQAVFTFSYSNLTGMHDLIVKTPFTGELTLEKAFNLMEAQSNPEIVSVVPDTGYQGQTLTVSVTGKDIVFMPGTSFLHLEKDETILYPQKNTVINDTVINGEFAFQKTDPTGDYDVVVDNGNSWPTLTLKNGFYLKLFNFIGDNKEKSLLTVYPNPTKGVIYLKRNVKGDKTVFDIKIFDLKGALLTGTVFEGGKSALKLDLRKYPSGTYILQIESNGKKESGKIVIE